MGTVRVSHPGDARGRGLVGDLRGRERSTELTRIGLSRRIKRLAFGRRRPLPGHVVRVSHACPLPKPRTTRSNRRQDAGGAVSITALPVRLRRRSDSGPGRLLAAERRPAEDPSRLVHAVRRLALRRDVDRPRAAVVGQRAGPVPYRGRLPVLRRNRMRTARRPNRPLWTSRRRRQWSGRPRRRRLGTRSIRGRPWRRTTRDVHCRLSSRSIRSAALEVRQPLLVGQLPPVRPGVFR
jgi:hypothetical protein